MFPALVVSLIVYVRLRMRKMAAKSNTKEL